MATRTWLPLVLAWWLAIGCSRPDTGSSATGAADNQQFDVYVVNYPLRFLATRIGGDEVAVHFPVPKDADPAYWSPDTDTLAGYQAADLILLNGAGYAGWTQSVSLPESKLVDTSATAADRYIELDGALTHSHGPGGEHAHGGTAFTTWLDLTVAIAQADTICAELVRRCPEHEAQFKQRHSQLVQELAELDSTLAKLAAGNSNQPLLFSHPVYQYFIERYELNGRSVHWEPHETPSAEQWAELDGILEVHPAKWMLWEAEPAPETAEQLQQRGIRSVVVQPCGNAPDQGDFLAVMRQNIENIRPVFEEP